MAERQRNSFGLGLIVCVRRPAGVAAARAGGTIGAFKVLAELAHPVPFRNPSFGRAPL